MLDVWTTVRLEKCCPVKLHPVICRLSLRLIVAPVITLISSPTNFR